MLLKLDLIVIIMQIVLQKIFIKYLVMYLKFSRTRELNV